MKEQETYGSTLESEGVSKQTQDQIIEALKSGLHDHIEKAYPNHKLIQEERYTLDVLKGHNCYIDTYIQNKQTLEKTLLVTHKVKIPSHVPKWITRHNLWHHTDKELKYLALLANVKGEKNPSKQTLTIWREYLDKLNNTNVSKTNNNQNPYLKIV